MRQLLGRKSKSRLTEDQDVPRGPIPPVPVQHTDLLGERVFPIRNVGQGRNPDLYNLSPNLKVDNSPIRLDETRSEPMNLLPPRSREGSRISSMARSDNGTRNSDEQRKVFDRSQFVATTNNGPPRIFVGPDSGSATYRRCEDEPIHTPGAIQSFGAILGLKLSSSGQLEVRLASENTRKVLGYGPEQLFALPSFLDVLKKDFRDEMVAHVNNALRDVDVVREETRLDVFQMILTFPYEPEVRLWCAIHLAPNSSGLVLCEFEEYSDAAYLGDVEAAKILPVTPFHLMGADVSPGDLKKSTTSASKPLPVFEIARQRQNKEFSALDLFNAMSQAESQISRCKDMQSVFDVSVGLIAELTGFHRVMMYRFDSQKNGCVDAELLNIQASSDVFRGLHYPASDIPKQARELYKINRIRLLHDRDATTARLVCRSEREFEKPIDLTHSYLRAFSPIHGKYLTNMGVKSTMSVSVVINGDLWGLIACHGYGDVGVRVSPPIRELCRNIGECAAINIQRHVLQQRIEARKAPTVSPLSQTPANFSMNTSIDLLKLVDADFALLSIGNKPHSVGKLEPQPFREAMAVMLYLQSCRYNIIRYSQNIKVDLPGFSYPPGLNSIAGFLFVPINVGEGNDFFVFFRKSQPRDVQWAGNPHAKKYKPGSEYLEPRSSFKRWAETIVGTSREWTEDQLDRAAMIGVIYERFLDLWPQKGAAGSNRLALIRNSSEKVQNRFNSVVHYVEMALEHSNDDKIRDFLFKAEKSSTSMMSSLDDLLKLTNLGDDETKPIEKTFNLNLTASKVMKDLQREAQRKGLDLTVLVQVQRLPFVVKGDGDSFKQLLVYYTNNAFKQCTSVRVDVSLIRTDKDSSTIGITVQDTGPGMTDEELDDIFEDVEKSTRDETNWPLTGQSSPSSSETNVNSTADLAAIVQYVQSANGQIRVASEPGKGTIFTVEIPFEHVQAPEASKPKKIRNLFMPSLNTAKTGSSTNPPTGPPSPKSPRPDIQVLRESAVHVDSGNWARADSQVTVGARQSQFDHPHGSSYGASSQPGSVVSSSGTGDMDPLVALNVLVAESNPSNLRSLDEKLSQWGHTVDIASNGTECHENFAADPSKVDVILMDVDMPGADGLLSTRMIRFWEKETKNRIAETRGPQSPKHRVAIIAVSSSLSEESRFDYIQNGFDGWVVRPIDFRRLNFILQGVKNPQLKRDALYAPGQWARGGWLSL